VTCHMACTCHVSGNDKHEIKQRCIHTSRGCRHPFSSTCPAGLLLTTVAQQRHPTSSYHSSSSESSSSSCGCGKQRCAPCLSCSTLVQGRGPGVPAAHGSMRVSRCPAGGRSCRSLWPGTHTLRQWPAQVQRQWPMQTPAVAFGRAMLVC
jgi:hypothetical protein